MANRGEPTIRAATDDDLAGILRVERAAQAIVTAHGIRLDELDVPEGIDAAPEWSLGLVAVAGDLVVGVARLTELTSTLLALDQVSVHPEQAGQGLGTRLLTEAAAQARLRGYGAITGTTFRDVAFNGPFYASLGSVEDPDPHPAMMQRRQVEKAVGLDALGPRVIMRLSLSDS